MYKTNDKNKLFCKSFLLRSCLIQNILYPFFNFGVIKELQKNLSIFHLCNSMKIIKNSCYGGASTLYKPPRAVFRRKLVRIEYAVTSSIKSYDSNKDKQSSLMRQVLYRFAVIQKINLD